jgi:cell wall assembly regulator SMI1
MDTLEYKYHYELMEQLDPDVLVNDLELETADIMARFPTEVKRFIEENYG